MIKVQDASAVIKITEPPDGLRAPLGEDSPVSQGGDAVLPAI